MTAMFYSFSSESLPKVSVKDISAAHLISYHQDRDLLPMVLANCNYSFEVGQGTKVEYNFTDIERQLKDRFLFKKSIVILKEVCFLWTLFQLLIWGCMAGGIQTGWLLPIIVHEIYSWTIHPKLFKFNMLLLITNEGKVQYRGFSIPIGSGIAVLKD